MCLSLSQNSRIKKTAENNKLQDKSLIPESQPGKEIISLLASHTLSLLIEMERVSRWIRIIFMWGRLIEWHTLHHNFVNLTCSSTRLNAAISMRALSLHSRSLYPRYLTRGTWTRDIKTRIFVHRFAFADSRKAVMLEKARHVSWKVRHPIIVRCCREESEVREEERQKRKDKPIMMEDALESSTVRGKHLFTFLISELLRL